MTVQPTRDWRSSASIFEPDGSLRDIVVQDCTINDWVALFYYLGGKPGTQLTYPANADEFWSDPPTIFARYPLQPIWVRRSNIELKCDIVTVDLIEFDLDPKLIRGQVDFDALIWLMRDVSLAVKKPVLLTEEGSHSQVLLTVDET